MRRRLLRLVLHGLRLLPPTLAVRLQSLKPPYYQLGAAAVLTDDDGRWLIVRHTYRTGWGLPGGGVASGEGLSDTVHRELREELGVEVDLGPSFMFHEPHINHITAVFTGTVVAGVPEARSVEIDEVVWRHPDDFGATDRFLRLVSARLPGMLSDAAADRLITDR